MQEVTPKKLPPLSVVIPCLNEESNVSATIHDTLQAFEHYGIDGNIVVVNDGSSDRTADVIAAWVERDDRVSLLNHEYPKGVGASFWDGVKVATGDFVMMMPGDNENDPIDSLCYYYLTQDVDIIVPFIMNIEVRSKFRRIVSSLYRLVINLSFGLNLNYTNGTVIYNRHLLNNIDLKTTGFLYHSELLIKLIRGGYFYAETPHLLAVRGSGKSNALTLYSLGNVMSGYLRLMWEIHFTRREGRVNIKLNTKSVTYRRYRGLP
jgi:dolichol-phosphate mannosyltransferase